VHGTSGDLLVTATTVTDLDRISYRMLAEGEQRDAGRGSGVEPGRFGFADHLTQGCTPLLVSSGLELQEVVRIPPGVP
jgi:hypothetical protein